MHKIDSHLIKEACSACLIRDPNWTDKEQKEVLMSWLWEVEIMPLGEALAMKTEDKRQVGQQRCRPNYYNGNVAMAVLMCYNVVDRKRNARSNLRLVGAMYQGQKKE